jgi:hypothetical protein
MTGDVFKLGVLARPSIQQWQLNALRQTVKTTSATVSTVIVDYSESGWAVEAIGRLIRLGL